MTEQVLIISLFGLRDLKESGPRNYQIKDFVFYLVCIYFNYNVTVMCRVVNINRYIMLLCSYII